MVTRVEVGSVIDILDPKQAYAKIQMINDDMKLKREMLIAERNELRVFEEEQARIEYRTYLITSQERVVGRTNVKYEKEAERKAAVQVNLIENAQYINAKRMVAEKKSKVSMLEISVQWLMIERRIWRDFAKVLLLSLGMKNNG